MKGLPIYLASIGKGVREIRSHADYIQAEQFLINNLRTLRNAQEPSKTRVLRVDSNNKPSMWYETTRLFNGLYHKKREEFIKKMGQSMPQIEKDHKKEKERVDYTHMKYVSVGGENIDERLWPESLLGKMEAQTTKITLATCITMYNEDWKEFECTIRGVV